MRFNWSEEQRLLQSTLQDFLGDRHSFEMRRQRLHGGPETGIWNELAELGILGLPFAAEHGGSGGSPLDTLIVMEAFGRALVPEPFVPCVVLAGGLLRLLGSEAQKSEYIPHIISGKSRFAFGFSEAQSRFNLANVATEACLRHGQYVLNGHKSVVYGAPESQMLLLTARTGGGQMDHDGISVFLVPCDTEGVEMNHYRCVDGMAASEVTLKEIRLPADHLLGEADQAFPAVERVIDEAIAAVCGEAVGMMGALVEKCVAYGRSRQAFGKPIAEFQAIAHRLVDMHVAHEVAAALTIKTAATLTKRPAEASRMASACKAQVGRESAFVGKTAVQLHGAIGISDELDIGHYFKRLTAVQTLFGGTDFHLRRYIERATLNS